MSTVSVVIPTYKPGPLLRIALESARAQGPAVAEVILVDDASPAEFQPLLDELAAEFSARLVRRTENGGPAAGHNSGIRVAAGDLIAFLEHDDVLLPGDLARQAAALAEHPDWGMCYAGYHVIDGDGKHVEDPAVAYLQGDEALRRLLSGNYIWTMSTVVVRRRALADVGELDESFRIAQDYDLWLRLGTGGWGIGCVPERLVAYRVHAGNSSALSRERCIRETQRALEKVRDARPDLWPWAVGHYARNWYRLGKELAREGDRAGARECFGQACRERPLYVKAHLRRLACR